MEKRQCGELIKGIVKWNNRLNLDIEVPIIFNNIYKLTNDTKLRCFQYKLLHNILPSNKLLYKMGIKQNNLCNFCLVEEDSVQHYLWKCTYVQSFWESFSIWLTLTFKIEAWELKEKEAILGIFSDESAASTHKIKQFIFLLAKNYIHCSKWCNTLPIL